jgi:hypothetical protein
MLLGKFFPLALYSFWFQHSIAHFKFTDHKSIVLIGFLGAACLPTHNKLSQI